MFSSIVKKGASHVSKTVFNFSLDLRMPEICMAEVLVKIFFFLPFLLWYTTSLGAKRLMPLTTLYGNISWTLGSTVMFFTYLESALQYKEFVGGLCNPWNMFLSPLRNVLSFFVYLPIFKGMRAFYGGLVDLLRYSQSLSWRADSNYVKNITVYIDPRVQKISSYKVVKGINLFASKLIVHRSKNGKQKKIFLSTL